MAMKSNNTRALIVAYYLSKFDTLAYEHLGFHSHMEAHVELGRKLGVNPNSVKNMRDEFDPIHDNPRAGWYQRPLRPSRARVVEAFQNLSEVELRDVVLEILTDAHASSSDELAMLISPIVAEDKKTGRTNAAYIVRGPTGRRAEQFFMEYHSITAEPAAGHLSDTRDDGCGYDFEITNNSASTLVEVKGLDGNTGGISFTSKEWEVATQNGDGYVLAIVRNISGDPDIQFIRNPAKALTATRSVYTIAQVRWNVSGPELRMDT